MTFPPPMDPTVGTPVPMEIDEPTVLYITESNRWAEAILKARPGLLVVA